MTETRTTYRLNPEERASFIKWMIANKIKHHLDRKAITFPVGAIRKWRQSRVKVAPKVGPKASKVGVARGSDSGRAESTDSLSPGRKRRK